MEPPSLQDRIHVVNKVLLTQRTLPAKLEATAAIFERMLDGCDAASIGLVVQGQAGTGAAASGLAIEADLAQYGSGEGPCLDAVSSARVVRIDVLDHDQAYRHFAPMVLELGIESVVSVPLHFDGRVVGSANLYSRSPGAAQRFDLEAVRPILDYTARLIATSPLYAYTLELLDELQVTVEERDTIDRAVGALMQTNGCTEATALTLLRRAAAAESRTIIDVAALIIDSNAALPHPDHQSQPLASE